MSCRYVSSRIDPYIDGELPADEIAAIRSHVARCSNCASELARHRSVKKLVAALPAPPPPGDLEARLVSTVLSSSTATKQASVSNLKFGFVAAAAVIAGFAVYNTFLKRDEAPRSEITAGAQLHPDRFYDGASNPLSPGVPVSFDRPR